MSAFTCHHLYYLSRADSQSVGSENDEDLDMSLEDEESETREESVEDRLRREQTRTRLLNNFHIINTVKIKPFGAGALVVLVILRILLSAHFL